MMTRSAVERPIRYPAASSAGTKAERLSPILFFALHKVCLVVGFLSGFCWADMDIQSLCQESEFNFRNYDQDEAAALRKCSRSGSAKPPPSLEGAADWDYLFPESVLEERCRMNLSDVAQLIKLLDKSSLSEISFSDESTKVVLKKEPAAPVGAPALAAPVVLQGAPLAAPLAPLPAAPAPAAPAAAPASPAAPAPAEAPKSKLKEITSPMVGTFYSSSTPGGSPLVAVGSRVSTGQVICIIEAMKIMNEIECDAAGTVEEVCVSNETPVEYGMVLFRIRPD